MDEAGPGRHADYDKATAWYNTAAGRRATAFVPHLEFDEAAVLQDF